ncbi:MAG TPA: CAP domain-containing protein [Casimicrobiaceae bacterium]|nr:CAP domain-containing protein [Casimicrobiaceae bacterium]
MDAATRVGSATNDFRGEHKLARLTHDEELAKAATYFAEYMARTGRYGHGADGNSATGRAKKFGYDYCIVAENIAYQFSSRGFSTDDLATRLFEGWRNSPGHRKNMLDPDVTETAVAIASSRDTGYFYAVQLFGRPQSASIVFSIENRSATVVEYTLEEQRFPLPPRVTRTHERCRPSTLTVLGKTIEPRNGQSLVIERRDGDLRVNSS